MITIRTAKLKEAGLITDMWKEFMKYHDEILAKKNPKLKPYLIKKKNAPQNFKAFIQKNIRSRNAVVHIAEIDGKAAGYHLSYIKPIIPVFKLDKIGYMADLFVKKEFRGLGISSRFKEEAFKWFKKKGMKHASIAVYFDNTGPHSIYKKWGFMDYHVEMRKKL